MCELMEPRGLLFWSTLFIVAVLLFLYNMFKRVESVWQQIEYPRKP